MTESIAPRGDDQSQGSEDELRRHAEDASEGDTPETGADSEVPREHSEDAAEG